MINIEAVASAQCILQCLVEVVQVVKDLGSENRQSSVGVSKKGIGSEQLMEHRIHMHDKLNRRME